MIVLAGQARRNLDPPPKVELTGWGYYLERSWQTVADSLHCSAIVLDDGRSALAIASVDLMVIDSAFTQQVRQQVTRSTGIPGERILVAATHTHNAPAAGGLLGVGEVDPAFEAWSARQTAQTIVAAWQNRAPATLRSGQTEISGLTFNRTRENGPVDPSLTLFSVTGKNGQPRAMIVNFQAHPTLSTELQPRAVSRDIPGIICDGIESHWPDCTCLYLQGACGDVNFLRSFSTESLWKQPGQKIAEAVIDLHEHSNALESPSLAARQIQVRLPTRRWLPEEVEADRRQASQRLEQHDLSHWRETIGRVMTNRPDDMVKRHGGDEWKAVSAMCRFGLEWTDRIQDELETRPEYLETEVLAFRIGHLGLVANSSEFFTSLALDVRARSPLQPLMIAAYANGRIGYLPDEHDVLRKSYAAYQSPKYCNQFPFTAESGPVMCDAMIEALETAVTAF